MKTVVDLFVAKDRTAIFWFMLACVSIVLSGMYVSRVVADLSTKPVYLIMDANGVYYVAPSLEFENATPLHEAQTRLAMETIYNRGPRDIVYVERLRTLFFGPGIEKVNADLRKEAKKFIDEERDQTIEVTDIKILKVDPKGGVKTQATGIITRHSNIKGQPRVETFKVTNVFLWKINKGMGKNGLFPTVCFDMSLNDPVPEEAP